MSVSASAIVGAAAIGAAAQHGGEIINNMYARNASKKEFERNITMWNMQNEYNKPINQMARLREAGLNPNLAYGDLSSSTAGSIHPASRENVGFHGQIDAMSYINAYQNLQQVDAQTQNIKAQTAVATAQKDVAKAQKAYIEAQTEQIELANKENKENGTSKDTPLPVKVSKTWASKLVRANQNVDKAILTEKHGILHDRDFYNSLNSRGKQYFKLYNMTGYNANDYRDFDNYGKTGKWRQNIWE